MSESDSQLIDRLILGLPKSEVLLKWMLKLRAEGLTHAEIAAEVGISRDAVTQRLSRARKSKRGGS